MRNDLFAAANEMIVSSQAEYDQSPAERDWLRIANQAFQASSAWLDTSQRAQWLKSIANFQSQHPPQSKYHTDAYKSRSRLFRPLTRRTIRRHEALASMAFFQNPDLVTVEPGNADDPQQLAAADIYDALLQYRLDRTIPWFQVLMGAYQSAMVQGACAAKWYWRYSPTLAQAPSEGLGGSGQDAHDEPYVELIPLENLRLDPASNWIDPINSSPYIIQVIPMFATDVMTRMQRPDPQTGEPLWTPLALSDIVAHGISQDDEDLVRRRREQSNRDKYNVGDPSEFQTVWVREYILRRGGQDWIFWTLGSTKLLSSPMPIERVYRHGRPFVFGRVVIEAFRSVPPGVTELTQDLQALANTIVNQRVDNVQLVLNKRYFVRRGAAVDTGALMRSIPGGYVLMENPAADVNIISTPDVTQSAYAEQDRVNMDFDELSGVMAQSTVGANRQLNETVGGMNLISSGADAMAEYQLRTFVETFVDPSLKLLVKLEKEYESDVKVLTLVGQRAQLWKKYGTNTIDDALLDQDVTVKVSISTANSTPQARVSQFLGGLQAATQVPEMAQRLKPQAVLDELFSRLGHRDPTRFFMNDDEFKQDQQAKMQQAGAAGGDPRVAIAQMQTQLRQQELQQQLHLKQLELENQRVLAFAQLASKKDLTIAELQAQMQTSQADIQAKRDIHALETSQAQDEMVLATRIGHGI